VDLVEVPKYRQHDEQRYGQNEEEGNAHEQRPHFLFPERDDPVAAFDHNLNHVIDPKIILHAVPALRCWLPAKTRWHRHLND
jgi:hypothetical protein